ncbi:MAG: hypothetical protein JEZ00_22115 [Anaerolineaceae bacterium]|nr:hypothetical protein [Anaerolineaceae bacterium]
MNKFPVRKIQKTVFMLSIIFALIACRFPDAVKTIVESAVEDCSIVSRDVYEISATQLGQTPETPKYPESAVYEVCFIDMEVSSVRMIDGNNTEDDELTESEETNSIPAGSYVGTIIDTEWKQRDWFGSPPEVLGTVAENEVIIFITEDGTVTGSLKYIVNGTILMSDTSHGITCTVLNDRSYDGEASGKLLENKGKIIFEGEWHEVTSYSEECNIEEHESATLQDIEIHVQVEIKNGTMYGTSVPSEGSRFHELSIILQSD